VNTDILKLADLLKLLVFVLLLFSRLARACIWDADTLEDEKKQHPTLAQAILFPTNEIVDAARLTARIEELRAASNENDPAWYNDLAGAYIRLGQPAEAVKILEPQTNRFAADYGIHANLGTAYHLLGRYSDAEREIARDLEINPDAHFGLEKYHLALLQYLIRDDKYRLRHVYVDEFSYSFLMEKGMRVGHYPSLAGLSNSAPDAVLKAEGERWTETLLKDHNYAIGFTNQLYTVGEALAEMAQYEQAPAYQKKQPLGDDPNLEKGVIYMETLNPKEPACWVMLGIVAVKNSDKNLTIAAYEKAIELGSVQAPILRSQIAALKDHIRQARQTHAGMKTVGSLVILLPTAFVGLVVFLIVRRLVRG
jgi:tetratricopeptide (TPR) repeat protein